jgi:hypothetical protein
VRSRATDTDAEHAVHKVVRHAVIIAQSNDVPQFMFHHGQQVDVIHGLRVVAAGGLTTQFMLLNLDLKTANLISRKQKVISSKQKLS